jgi:hypothetical protein
MPVHRIAPTRSALGGSLAVLIATAALLVTGVGVATANPTPPNPFVVTPGASIPSPLPCGTVAEFATPWGYQFPVAETGSILAAFRLPAAQVSTYLAEFRQLGTFLSALTIPTPTCGTAPGGVVGE